MQAVSDGMRWMLRLSEGEELLESLGAFADAHELSAAAVAMGIGQLASAELGFWNGADYERRTIGEHRELVSLGGSIARSDGRPSVHLHASLGGRDLSVVAGHLFRGTVGVLAELLVVPFPALSWDRPMNESIGLRILDLAPSRGGP